MEANQDKNAAKNAEKPTLKLRAQADAEAAEAAAAIAAAKEASLAAEQAAAAPAPVEVDKAAQREAELEAGRQAVARHAANAVAAAEAPVEVKAPEPKEEEFVSIAALASQGRDVLLDALRKHAETPATPAYTPPPMTERQLTAREAELEAGRKAVARAEEQKRLYPPPPVDAAKEGFTTPVYRPGGDVPDPTGAGMKAYSPDA